MKTNDDLIRFLPVGHEHHSHVFYSVFCNTIQYCIKQYIFNTFHF